MNSRERHVAVSTQPPLGLDHCQPPGKKTPSISTKVPETSAVGRLISIKHTDDSHESDLPSDNKDAPLPEPNKAFGQLSLATIEVAQLVQEIKGIYSGLVLVESRCIEVYRSDIIKRELKIEKWQALMSLHHSLLLEHHDFFLATNHPAATPILRNLPEKYNMPARMWKHGIHSFLELMRKNLPHTIDLMHAFLSITYGMMSLLYETVLPYRKVWAECLGDLARYRMAIEEHDREARDIWMQVSRSWYRNTLEMLPNSGRLYHHMAILARPQPLTQLFYYTKSLCTNDPFMATKESISMLIDPSLSTKHANSIRSNMSQVDANFVAIHGLMFKMVHGHGKSAIVDQSQQLQLLEQKQKDFYGHLREDITRHAMKWLESGIYVGLANVCSLLEYSNDNKTVQSGIGTTAVFASALAVFCRTLETFTSGPLADPISFPYLHTTFVFLAHLSSYPDQFSRVAGAVPWGQVARNLNAQIKANPDALKTIDIPFPSADKNKTLPDDYSLRGFEFAESYFPRAWFDNDLEESEKLMERPSMKVTRSTRILSLARSLSKRTNGQYLSFDPIHYQFAAITASLDLM